MKLLVDLYERLVFVSAQNYPTTLPHPPCPSENQMWSPLRRTHIFVSLTHSYWHGTTYNLLKIKSYFNALRYAAIFLARPFGPNLSQSSFSFNFFLYITYLQNYPSFFSQMVLADGLMNCNKGQHEPAGEEGAAVCAGPCCAPWRRRRRPARSPRLLAHFSIIRLKVRLRYFSG
jgi:hypothetical protein